MALTASSAYPFERLLQARTFRHARCYASDPVMNVLRPITAAPELALVVDVDALERSALARIDRIMVLALDALAHARVQVYLLVRYERERAKLLQSAIAGARCVTPAEALALDDRMILISDDPALLCALGERHRGVALGRPELASPTVAAAGDSTVRATLWWLLEERRRELAA